MREETLELMIKLRCQRFVVRHDQRRAVRRFDHLRHGEGFARTRNSQQHLVLLAVKHTSHQGFDSLSLIATRLIVTYETEIHVGKLAALRL